jgi:hypothetical protein
MRRMNHDVHHKKDLMIQSYYYAVLCRSRCVDCVKIREQNADRVEREYVCTAEIVYGCVIRETLQDIA